MKLLRIIFSIAFCFGVLRSVSGQNFTNLDFESASVSGDSVGDGIPTSSALPGWSAAFINSDGTDPQDQVTYDGLSTGGAVISILDANAIYVLPLQGQYSALLTGGGGPFSQSDLPTSAQISQNGLVPGGTESLLFDASLAGPAFTVTLGGQTINMTALQTFSISGSALFSNYTLYGGTIPSLLAGQVETLSFTEPPEPDGHETFFELDDIQFSASPVPEPGALGLSILGGFLFGFRSLRKLFSN